jgi:hypothetical protein
VGLQGARGGGIAQGQVVPASRTTPRGHFLTWPSSTPTLSQASVQEARITQEGGAEGAHSSTENKLGSNKLGSNVIKMLQIRLILQQHCGPSRTTNFYSCLQTNKSEPIFNRKPNKQTSHCDGASPERWWSSEVRPKFHMGTVGVWDVPSLTPQDSVLQ